MKIIHFCAGLEGWNGMANTARQFVVEERAAGHDSRLTNRVEEIAAGTDVVEVHGAWLSSVHQAARRAKAVGAKLIVRPAGSYDPVRLRYHGWKKWLAGPWERAMLRRADIVQVTCAAEAKWVETYLGKEKVKSKKEEVEGGRGKEKVKSKKEEVEGGRGKEEVGRGAPRIEITDLKRFFNLEKEEGKSKKEEVGNGRALHVLYLGRRHPLKGVAFLERAVQEINDECKMEKGEWDVGNVELRIVSGHFGDELERDWAWCDVLCLPTLSENFGRVVAEALERGKRVITTDGAPAWEDLTPEQGVYLRGYRDGDEATRVRLLVEALQGHSRPARRV